MKYFMAPVCALFAFAIVMLIMCFAQDVVIYVITLPVLLVALIVLTQYGIIPRESKLHALGNLFALVLVMTSSMWLGINIEKTTEPNSFNSLMLTTVFSLQLLAALFYLVAYFYRHPPKKRWMPKLGLKLKFA